MEDPKDRVIRARLAKGFREAKQAAEAANWKYETYKKIESGLRSVTPQWAAKIGRFYNVRPAWILFGEPPINRAGVTNLTKTVAFREIPILSWRDVKTRKDIERGISMAHAVTSAPPYLGASDLAFALHIADDSMVSKDNKRESFEIGDEVIFDPSQSVSPGDFVLVYVRKLDQSLFRQLRLAAIHADGTEEAQLVPLNPNWPIITISRDIDGHIVAKMIRHSISYL